MSALENVIMYWRECGAEAYTVRHDNRADWADDTIAESYLKKYGLYSNWESNWEELQKSIFYLDRQLPDMIFKKDFEFISLLGGVTFEQEDFEQLQSCLQQIGERKFYVVQDTYGMSPDQKKYALKMKYPSNIGWDELMSGNFISTILFETYPNHYYVFGDSGAWGMYVATDYVDEAVNPAGTPIRIIGFDPKYRAIFRDTFEIPEGEYCENVDYIPEEERPDLKEWVPEKYRK